MRLANVGIGQHEAREKGSIGNGGEDSKQPQRDIRQTTAAISHTIGASTTRNSDAAPASYLQEKKQGSAVKYIYNETSSSLGKYFRLFLSSAGMHKLDKQDTLIFKNVPFRKHFAAVQACCLMVFVSILLISDAVNCIVVYQVHMTTLKSARTDYALAGESIKLSCHYTMKDDAEDIKQVTWSKDGKNFLKWRKNKPGLEVLSYTYKGHIDQSSDFSRMIIHNVTIEMHGKYKCSIKTDLGTHFGELDLVVVSSPQCKRNDWNIMKEQAKCQDTLRFDCRNMFPKPVASCGLWNSKSNKFIRSVIVDVSDEGQLNVSNETGSNQTLIGLKNQQNTPMMTTFRIRYLEKFSLKQPNGSVNSEHADLLQFAGNLIFRCDLFVPETSWKLEMSHKMFDYHDGCNQDPLEAIERMRQNFSQYAAQRMQQAGYLDRQQHAEDIGILSGSLRYDIIPLSHLISSDRNSIEKSTNDLSSQRQNANKTKVPISKAIPENDFDFNCWLKPRIGSFARLSCADMHRKRIRLVGANLLECRPDGWMLVKSSVTSLGEPTVARKLQVVDRKTAALANSRRPTRAERPDGQVIVTGGSDPKRNEGPDLENDDDNPIKSDTNVPKLISNEVEGSTSSIVDTYEEKIRFENDIAAVGEEQLAPSELASLLPTCVSFAPTKPKKPSHRLPKIEASSVRNNGKLLTKDGRNPSDDENWNWYIFSSSGMDSIHEKQNAVIILIAFVASIYQTHIIRLRGP